MSGIEFSILIARASTEDSDRILETLEAVKSQAGVGKFEIIVVDRLNDATTREIEDQFPNVHLECCSADASIPAMRARALELSSGQNIVVTEDHCVPPKDWLLNFRNLLSRAPDETAVVSGTVANGLTQSVFDWANFICEYYSFLPFPHEGEVNAAPGMNTCYKRAHLEKFGAEKLRSNFWEIDIHSELQAEGKKFYSSSDIQISHIKKFSIYFFCVQRFHYSRYYAGTRFQRVQYGRRALSAISTVAVPPLILGRMTAWFFKKKRFVGAFLASTPLLILFTSVWAAGEFVGYLAGPGASLEKIE